MKRHHRKVETYIDELGRLLMTSQALKQLGVQPGELVDLNLTQAGMELSQNRNGGKEPAPDRQCYVSYLHIQLGMDLCRSKGLMEQDKKSVFG